MNILSIQSSVAFGHAGNSAATFPLQRLGHEVWPVYTVHFSNHTGYGEWRGPVFDPETVRDVITGISERGVFPSCNAVLSGYQGDERVGEVILDTVRAVKQANPDAVYCCDPVMGDEGRGFYVREGIPEFMRDEVVPHADILTPNHFELEFLTGREITTRQELLDAADSLCTKGPRVVLATSVKTAETPEGSVQMAAVTEKEAWLVTTPFLPLYISGSGDATAAIFLARLLDAKGSPDGLRQALEATASSIYGLMKVTHERSPEHAGMREILLIEGQDAIAEPKLEFEAVQLR